MSDCKHESPSASHKRAWVSTWALCGVRPTRRACGAGRGRAENSRRGPFSFKMMSHKYVRSTSSKASSLAPADVDRACHRIASTNQHALSTVGKITVAKTSMHGVCEAAESGNPRPRETTAKFQIKASFNHTVATVDEDEAVGLLGVDPWPAHVPSTVAARSQHGRSAVTAPSQHRHT